jgi:hypothetical protein
MTLQEPIERYPLQWPAGWPRTPYSARRRAKFSHKSTEMRSNGSGGTWAVQASCQLSIATAIRRLEGEMRRLHAQDWLISSNVPTRLDGMPFAKAGNPADPGVAVYFRFGATREPRVLACDAWDRVADNIAAVAGHVDALRKIDRYGVGSLEQAFAGYAALPANTAADWRAVFGFPKDSRPTKAQVNVKFQELARSAHPDRGGSHEQMARLTEARAFAIDSKELSGS